MYENCKYVLSNVFSCESFTISVWTWENLSGLDFKSRLELRFLEHESALVTDPRRLHKHVISLTENDDDIKRLSIIK